PTHPHAQEHTTSPNNTRPPHHPHLPTGSHYANMGFIQLVPLGQHPQSARQQAFSCLLSSSDDHP
ncbi:hypothetical protein BDR05DRAFT_962723, partial [Suillus weaverae]